MSKDSKVAKRSCRNCGANTYKTGLNRGTKCTDQPFCGKGEYITADSKKAARACKPCGPNTYRSSSKHRSTADCAAWRTCAIARGMSTEGTASADRQCAACVVGSTFSPTDGPGACQPIKVCTLHKEFETVEETASSDRECQAHRQCTIKQFETKAAGTHSDRECDDHTICGKREWEIKYEGSHHNRQCEIRAPCQHTQCKLFGGNIIISHNKKDHEYGSTHHHCKYDQASSTCNCMCHNAKIDAQFAYLPKKRFFWKKTTEQVAVRKGNCPEAAYSPSGGAAPGELTLCRAYSVGHKIALTDDADYVSMENGMAQGSSVVVFANDRISWDGASTSCPGFQSGAPILKTVEVYSCVEEVCPHPKCCDCGNAVCARGHGAASCDTHMP
jgi:hypothetical protein